MLSKLTDRLTIKVTVSNKTIVRIVLVVIGFYLGLQFLSATRTAVTLLLVAFFLALALNPPVSYLAKRLPGNSRGLATAVAYLAVIASLSLIIYATVPPLVQQTREFISDLPRYSQELKHGNGFLARQIDRLGLEDDLGNLESQVSTRLGSAGGPVFALLQRISANILAVLSVLVFTFFMLVEGPDWMNRFLRLQPKHQREHRKALADRMYKVVTGYVNGQILISFVGATSALIVMSILKLANIDIPFIIPLAAVIFITGLIPLFGNTLGAVVVVTVALFQSVTAAVIMAAFFLVYQQIENNAIQPVIQSRSVEMSPLMVLLAAIFGISLAGLLGALIAIPVVGCLRILLNDYLDRHRLRHDLDEDEV